MQELNYCVNGNAVRALYFESAVKDMPLIIDIHGGGFCYGRADDDAALCERLVRETNYNVVSFDYRLAPKYKYPAAIEDCCDLFDCICGDASRMFNRKAIYVMGHSAGAALVVALALRKSQIAGVVLNYPWLNIADNRRKWLTASIPGFVLDRMAKKYCPDKVVRTTPELSPLNADESELSKMPPILVITGGSDSLRTDGIAYAEKCESAGVRVKHIEYSAARHGFIEIVASGRMKKNFYTKEAAVREQIACYEEAIKEIINFVREK